MIIHFLSRTVLDNDTLSGSARTNPLHNNDILVNIREYATKRGRETVQDERAAPGTSDFPGARR